jgi:hypothetical protein
MKDASSQSGNLGFSVDRDLDRIDRLEIQSMKPGRGLARQHTARQALLHRGQLDDGLLGNLAQRIESGT